MPEPRKCRACRLPLSKSAFGTVISSKAVHAAHAGALEAGGVRLALRLSWRSLSRHARRTVLLVDSQAVKGANAKGRSLSATFRTEMMRIAALQLAGDLLLKLVCVPLEDNPADAPSRGIVRRWRRRASCVAVSQRVAGKRNRDAWSRRTRERAEQIWERVKRRLKDTVRMLVTTGTHDERRAHRQYFKDGDFSNVTSSSSSSLCDQYGEHH